VLFYSLGRLNFFDVFKNGLKLHQHSFSPIYRIKFRCFFDGIFTASVDWEKEKLLNFFSE